MTISQKQFDFLTRLMRCTGKAQEGARLVLVKGEHNADAARAVGATPQAVHRLSKRIAEEHETALRLFRS